MVQEALGTEEPRKAFDKRTIKPISFNHHLGHSAITSPSRTLWLAQLEKNDW